MTGAPMTDHPRKAFLILLISLILAGSLGGCGGVGKNSEWEYGYREYYDKHLEIEEMDDGVYMIAASMKGIEAWLRHIVFKKARDHCAQWNKAVKVAGKDAKSRAEFEIVFTCRERTKADTP